MKFMGKQYCIPHFSYNLLCPCSDGERDGHDVHPGPPPAEAGEADAAQEGRDDQRGGKEAEGEDAAGRTGQRKRFT